MAEIIICANFGLEKLRSFGYRRGRSDFQISHWNGWSLLQQCCTTAHSV